jgi:hypothetical protein
MKRHTKSWTASIGTGASQESFDAGFGTLPSSALSFGQKQLGESAMAKATADIEGNAACVSSPQMGVINLWVIRVGVGGVPHRRNRTSVKRKQSRRKLTSRVERKRRLLTTSLSRWKKTPETIRRRILKANKLEATFIAITNEGSISLSSMRFASRKP